jgi:hypothetical protein
MKRSSNPNASEREYMNKVAESMIYWLRNIM